MSALGLYLLLGLIAAAAAWSVIFTARVERRWPASGRMAQAGPYRLHVVEAGRTESDAPAVLLVHGAASNERVILHALGAALGPHARLIAADRPGCGHSPAFAARERLGAHADALAALIRAEGLEAPVVVGHSYGAATALRLALDHPQLVGAVVAVSPASHGYIGPVSWYNYVAAAPLIGRLVTRLTVPLIGPGMLKAALGAGFAPQTPPERYAEETGLALLFRPASFRSNALDLVRANPELAVQQLRYGSLAMPLAVIAGEEDPTVHTHSHAVPLAAAAQDARLALLPGVGHQAPLAAPELIAEHVRALLARRSSEKAPTPQIKEPS